jgi:ferredoxin
VAAGPYNERSLSARDTAEGKTGESMTAGLEVSTHARRGADDPGSDIRDDAFTLETQGWSSHPESCAPKIAALSSLVNLAPPDPVASVSYHSRGNLLIVAGDDPARARSAAAELGSALQVTLLEGEGASGAAWSGRIESLSGYLGEFTTTFKTLKAPGAGGNGSKPIPAKFDLVLDFSREPLFAMRQPPQGYFHAAKDSALDGILAELRESVGEFEKPRYFAYRENICAHSRSGIEGCNACIEICSTAAISADGDHVKVDPHLCMGCGACSTVCPSGAMGYQYPRVSDRGAQLKQLISAYRFAGGADPCIVFHNGADGRELLAAAARAGNGLPAHSLPLETWHVAAIGLDLLLPAIAFGASNVAVLAAGSEDAEYIAALREQMAIGEAILNQLGYSGVHFTVIEAAEPAQLESAFAALAPAGGVATPGTFLLGNDKRTAIEFAVEHLVKHAPSRVDEIALPAGAPFGQVIVDKAKCTMCLACVGSCPESALMDGVDQPLFKFLERNCVQCGLCESTCPEDAITLSPRLLLTPAVREARVLNETQPFHCIRCNKPFGTKQMVDAMMGRLAGHSMFAQGDALKRLQMCADCRVVDMMSSKNEVSVLRMGADS